MRSVVATAAGWPAGPGLPPSALPRGLLGAAWPGPWGLPSARRGHRLGNLPQKRLAALLRATGDGGSVGASEEGRREGGGDGGRCRSPFPRRRG